MNALANWLGITDQNAPRDYDNEAARAGFWDTVRQMSALAIAAGAKQSDASRAQILGQLANVSSPTAGATRYAQANMQNMAAQRQRQQFEADQNFTNGLDNMAGLSEQQRAILRAMGPGAREAYSQHAMARAFEDPMVSMLRQSQIADNLSQSELRKVEIEQKRREAAAQERFLAQYGLAPGGASAPAGAGMPSGGPSSPAMAAAGGLPPSLPPAAPQMPMQGGVAPQGGAAPMSPVQGLSRNDIVNLLGSGAKTSDVMKKNADLLVESAKPPPGFMWADENRTRLKPIPGSDKEAVAAEVGARLSQGEEFLANLPQIRAAIDGGVMDGVGASAKLALGMGAQAELWRQIDRGMEAIVRLNTGAGQNNPEMVKSAKQYAPSPLDSVETLRSKLNGLESVLNQTLTRVYEGRGGRDNRPLPRPMPLEFDENIEAARRAGLPVTPRPGAPSQGQQGGAPQIREGMVMDGHVFLGGDPASPQSWRPIAEGYAR